MFLAEMGLLIPELFAEICWRVPKFHSAPLVEGLFSLLDIRPRDIPANDIPTLVAIGSIEEQKPAIDTVLPGHPLF